MSVKLDSYVVEGTFLLPSYIFIFIMLAGFPTALMWTIYIVFLLMSGFVYRVYIVCYLERKSPYVLLVFILVQVVIYFWRFSIAEIFMHDRVGISVVATTLKTP